MLNGKLSPRINDFVTNEYFTSVEKSVAPVEKSAGVASDGTLHIEYMRDNDGKLIKTVEYKIVMSHISKEDSDILKDMDGQVCFFYPHSDNENLKYRAVIDMNSYHKNNMFFHDGFTAIVTANENDYEGVMVPS